MAMLISLKLDTKKANNNTLLKRRVDHVALFSDFSIR